MPPAAPDLRPRIQEALAASTAQLDRAVASFSRTFQRQAAALLQTGRDFVIPKASEQPSDKTDFELVTWLVLLPA